MEKPFVDTVKQMLLEEIAGHLHVEPQELDTSASVFDLGINSVWIVRFIGRLEDKLGFEISPDMLWDYESIDEFAGYLAEKHEEFVNRKGAEAQR